MSDQDTIDPVKPDLKEFQLGWDNPKDPKVMVFTVPVAFLATQGVEGSARLRGWFDEAKVVAHNMMRAIMKQNADKTAKILVPGAGPVKPLGVH